HTEQRGGAQELAPIDPALGKLALQGGDVAVFAIIGHGTSQWSPCRAWATQAASNLILWPATRRVKETAPNGPGWRCPPLPSSPFRSALLHSQSTLCEGFFEGEG